MIDPKSMTCEEARAGLWPPERPRLDGEEEAAARAHVRSCSACARYFAQDRALLESLDELRQRTAPRHVRERVLDALARARLEGAKPSPARVHETASAAAKPRRAATIPVLAGLASLILVGWAVSSRGGGDLDAAGAAVAEDYMRRAVAADYLVTDDPREVSRFLTRELGVQVAPLDIDGLDVESVEICLIDGRRGALVVYRSSGRRISHYLIPRPPGRTRPPAPAETDPMGGFATVPVVTWASPTIEHALVGELTVDTLVALARSAEPRP